MATQKNTTVPNVAPAAIFEPMEEQIGQDKERLMRSDKPAREALEEMGVEIYDGRPVDQEKIAMLAFMEEVVTIHVLPTTNPLDEEVFEVFCNGEPEIFRRNETKKVKRKFINILATNKITTYTQKRVRDDQGVMHDVQIPHTALKYPFSVTDDPNPRGPDWFRFVLAQH